jgi:glycosyltransferase involved in cell wall biosynthesis
LKPDLLILTNTFPNDPPLGESWLETEIPYTSGFFNSITFLPETSSDKHINLPENCRVVHLKREITQLNLKETWNCFYIVLTDLFRYPSRKDYMKAFRSNLALIKNLSLKAKNINSQLPSFKPNTIVYAYWADNLLTTACILKQQYRPCKVVSRGHGFEIFEEQTKYGVVPFRKFQSRFSNKIFADSKRGYEHLMKNDNTSSIYDYSYVGTPDNGMGVFNDQETFTIVTCSHVRNVKRLHLMADILQHISFSITWNIIGSGDDLERVKVSNAKLPANVKVNYIGNLSGREVAEFLKTRHSNLFVSLSFSEGLPVSMMEAQSFGIPIMSTDVGGCSEICNDETGFLIPKAFDGKDVAGKISEFKNSSKNTLEFRKQCRTHWEKNFNAESNYTRFATQIIES